MWLISSMILFFPHNLLWHTYCQYPTVDNCLSTSFFILIQWWLISCTQKIHNVSFCLFRCLNRTWSANMSFYPSLLYNSGTYRLNSQNSRCFTAVRLENIFFFPKLEASLAAVGAYWLWHHTCLRATLCVILGRCTLDSIHSPFRPQGRWMKLSYEYFEVFHRW